MPISPSEAMRNMTPKQKAAGAGTIALAIIGLIFANEGGFVDDKNDPGGATNWGCTEAVARADGYQGSMRALPRERCRQILLRQFIEAPGFMPIVEREPVLAYEIIDTGVNAGPARAKVWFQASLNVFNRGGRDYPAVATDGRIGPSTIAAYERLQRVRGPKRACELMVKSADAYQAAHYQKLCTGSAALSTFCAGWFDHRIGNAPIEHCGTGSL